MFDANTLEWQVSSFVFRAFYFFGIAEAARTSSSQKGDPVSEKEYRRLINLQLPMFLSVAAVQDGVDRVQVLEAALIQARKLINQARTRTSCVVDTAITDTVGGWEVDRFHITLLVPEQIEEFFRDLKQRCVGTTMHIPLATTLLPGPVFPIWNCLGSALTFQFQAEVGRSNALDESHLLYWVDSVESCLENRLGATTETHRRNAQTSLADEFELAISCLAVDQIWEFAVLEVTKLLGHDAKDLVLPDRTLVANDLFSRARELFSIRARTNAKWGDEENFVEIRTQGTLESGEPALDEIVAKGAYIHLEQMSPSSW